MGESSWLMQQRIELNAAAREAVVQLQRAGKGDYSPQQAKEAGDRLKKALDNLGVPPGWAVIKKLRAVLEKGCEDNNERVQALLAGAAILMRDAGATPAQVRAEFEMCLAEYEAWAKAGMS